jgi:predicted RNA methylase
MPSLFFGIFLIILLLIIKKSQERNRTTSDGAPWVPLEPVVIQNIINMAKIKENDVFYDLGSGDGRVVIAAALAGAKAYGVEIDPFRVLYSRFCISLFGLSKKAKIIHKNIFDVDFSKANIIHTYLLQETNDKLFSKFEKELHEDTTIISCAFNYSKLKPISINPNGPIYGPIYLYKFSKTKNRVKSKK